MREHIALAQEVARRVAADPRLELVAPVSLALVSFRHTAGADATRALAQAINADGGVHVTSSLLDGEPFIRVAVGQTRTTIAEVDRLWRAVESGLASAGTLVSPPAAPA